MGEVVDPLTPPECDLRDYGYFPLEIVRLFGSEFNAVATDSEWRAGITLCVKSFHQVPAGSLPDDDISLARLAEFGRDLKTWRKVKAVAMRGFVKCSDGRFYHPVVAEKALEAWVDRINRKRFSAAGVAKRKNEKFDSEQLDAEISKIVEKISRLNPNSRVFKKVAYITGKKPATAGTTAGTTAGKPIEGKGSKGKGSDVKGSDLTCLFKNKAAAATLCANNSTSGECQEENPPPPPQVEFSNALKGWEKQRGKVAKVSSNDARISAWVEAGLTMQQLRSAYDAAVEDRRHNEDEGPINTGFLGIFVERLRKAAGNSKSGFAKGGPWFLTCGGVEDKAKEIGVAHLKGEAWPYFRDRVFAHEGVTQEMVRKARADLR